MSGRGTGIDAEWGAHLFWLIPLAMLLSLPLWFFAAIGWCGVSGCTGGGFGIARGHGTSSYTALAISGALIALPLALVPWWKPWWKRVATALLLGLTFMLAGVYYTGGPTPPEGCSRPNTVIICE
jgi:hypothetical protein